MHQSRDLRHRQAQVGMGWGQGRVPPSEERKSPYLLLSRKWVGVGGLLCVGMEQGLPSGLETSCRPDPDHGLRCRTSLSQPGPSPLLSPGLGVGILTGGQSSWEGIAFRSASYPLLHGEIGEGAGAAELSMGDKRAGVLGPCSLCTARHGPHCQSTLEFLCPVVPHPQAL